MLELLRSPEIVVFLSSLGLGGLIWCVRLEGVVQRNESMRDLQVGGIVDAQKRHEKEIRDLRDRQDEADHRVAKDLEVIKIQLAELNGFLKRIFKERREDD